MLNVFFIHNSTLVNFIFIFFAYFAAVDIENRSGMGKFLKVLYIASRSGHDRTEKIKEIQ